MSICEYGCGQKATHQFKNGKWCCSKSQNSCPVVRRKNSDTNKIKQSGVLNSMYGKNQSDETKQKIRQKLKKSWNNENSKFHTKKFKQEALKVLEQVIF